MPPGFLLFKAVPSEFPSSELFSGNLFFFSISCKGTHFCWPSSPLHPTRLDKSEGDKLQFFRLVFKGSGDREASSDWGWHSEATAGRGEGSGSAGSCDVVG